MKLTVNGRERTTAAPTLAVLWREETEPLAPLGRQGFAIALNGAIVRAALWDTQPLNEGDRIDIVRAYAGG